jgi:hypothetical protein
MRRWLSANPWRLRRNLSEARSSVLRRKVSVRFPPGHYYSPLPDTRELAVEPGRSRVWPERPRETIGIDWRGEAQIDLCRNVFARQPRLELAMRPTGDPSEYHTENMMFPALDAWVLEAMLRHLRPARLIEIGCGFSSLVTARVNRELLGGGIDVTCIDPYPSPVLGRGVDGIDHLRAQRIQDTPLEFFDELTRDDVLFIDTSHTVKTGGDVPWIFEEVVPRLGIGVVVHIHDIFLPGDYPPEWVLDGWGWNEVYLVRAFLSFNSAFEVVFSVKWMQWNAQDVLVEAFPGLARPEHAERSGSSLWIRRVS